MVDTYLQYCKNENNIINFCLFNQYYKYNIPYVSILIYFQLCLQDSGNSEVTKDNDNLNIDSCISTCISETDVDINSNKDISEFENILHEVPI